MLKNRMKYGLLMVIGAIMILKYGYGELRYLIAFLKMKADLSYTNVGIEDLLWYGILTCVGILMICIAKLKILEYEMEK